METTSLTWPTAVMLHEEVGREYRIEREEPYVWFQSP